MYTTFVSSAFKNPLPDAASVRFFHGIPIDKEEMRKEFMDLRGRPFDYGSIPDQLFISTCLHVVCIPNLVWIYYLYLEWLFKFKLDLEEERCKWRRRNEDYSTILLTDCLMVSFAVILSLIVGFISQMNRMGLHWEGFLLLYLTATFCVDTCVGNYKQALKSIGYQWRRICSTMLAR